MSDGRWASVEKLQAYGESIGRSLLDLAIGWLAAQPYVACVIAGVSLRGGTGKVPYVVLDALFFGVVENRMNVSGVSS